MIKVYAFANLTCMCFICLRNHGLNPSTKHVQNDAEYDPPCVMGCILECVSSPSEVESSLSPEFNWGDVTFGFGSTSSTLSNLWQIHVGDVCSMALLDVIWIISASGVIVEWSWSKVWLVKYLTFSKVKPSKTKGALCDENLGFTVYPSIKWATIDILS